MKHLALTALALLLPAAALAQHEKFTADPAKSTIAFILGTNHGDDHGTFHVQSAAIDFDPKAATIAGAVVVSSLSGDTGNGSRDKKMAKDVLDAPHFAEITFFPKSYTGTLSLTGDSTLQLSGVFTLAGKPHDITVTALIHIEGGAATVKTHFVVPYVAWGLKDPSFMMFKVAKEIPIDLTLTGALAN